MKGSVPAADGQFLDSSGILTDVRRALGQVAQMMTGGLVIRSVWDADGDQTAIYAQTVIQLDGDVVTAYHPDMVARADREVLAAGHLKAVATAMKPLQQLVLHLAKVRYFAISAGTAGILVSGAVAWRSVDWTSILGLVVSSALAVGGVALRRLFLMIVRRRVRRLWLEAKKEAEELII